MRWTDTEDEVLTRVYGTMTVREIQATYLKNRSINSIYYRAKKLELMKQTHQVWSDSEILALKWLRKSNCPYNIIAIILGRSIGSVNSKADELGYILNSTKLFDDSELIQLNDYSDLMNREKELVNTNHLTIGKISELFVEIELLKRGYNVYKPYKLNHKVDYLVVKDWSTVKIQVKTGMYFKKEKVYRVNLDSKDSNGKRIPYESSDVDFFLIKCSGINEFYVIPYLEGNGKSLFLFPHRNKRYREKEVDFEIYRNAFELIEEKIKMNQPYQEQREK
ncbi:group I intron-associated PD-(D/E)XK endonuclease [Niallia sp. Krafla_26]|uniref:group I intron-associated PD-(D/E)XK endonuclease n=1 Tax=Niallia sp. Krafla_26 TaxID=3064703 RepID=UPI003D168389